MPVIVAAIVVVGVLCLLDLLLTFGVIRRLREHGELLSTRQDFDQRPVIGRAAGEVPGPFTAVTADGAVVAGPAGLRLAGFFSASCSVCPERVAPFTDYVRTHQIRRDQVLAVLQVEDGQQRPPYLGVLAEVARVSVQPMDSPVAEAFAVAGYPAFCLLDADGAIVSSGYDPSALPGPAMAVR